MKNKIDKPKTSRQIQAETMKNRIQGIVQEFSKKRTLDEIKIKEICDEANISVGNFYQYFSSKESALLYSYKCKDELWKEEHFEDIKDPLERVKKIVDTHLNSMVENSLCFDTQLYISQLKEYEEYFFSDDRYFTMIVRKSIEDGQELGEFTKEYSAKEIAKRILNFDRGLVYNYCIEHHENHDEWIIYAKDCQKQYLSLFTKG